MNVNPTDVAKKASPLCGGKVCYPTQPAVLDMQAALDGDDS